MIAILFDLDDTLYSRLDIYTLAYEKTFSSVCTFEQLSFREGISPEQSRLNMYDSFVRHGYDLYKECIHGGLSMDIMFVDRITKTMEDFGFTISEKEARAFQKNYEWEQGHIVINPQMRRVLDLCRDSLVFCGIVTNGDAAHQRKKYRDMKLNEWLVPEQFLPTQELGCSKPDPRTFLEAARIWNLNPQTDEIWYIGDSISHDIAGAQAAGLKSIWFKKNQVQPLSEKEKKIIPTFIAESENDLYEFLYRLISARNMLPRHACGNNAYPAVPAEQEDSSD